MFRAYISPWIEQIDLSIRSDEELPLKTSALESLYGGQ